MSRDVSCQATGVAELTPDPVRDASWFTIFNFKPSATQFLPSIPVGTQLLVEGEFIPAVLANSQPRSTRVLPPLTAVAAMFSSGKLNWDPPKLTYSEISHQVISKKKQDQQ